jgi:hypothetical protein
VIIPGNLYVPNQFVGLSVREHTYQIRDHRREVDDLVALGGQIAATDAISALGSGGSASTLLSQVSFSQIGVRLNTQLNEEGSEVTERTIPLSLSLNDDDAQCTIVDVPDDTYASCISAGEWTEGGVGTGRLFPMGIVNINAEDLADRQSVTRDLSFAPLVGEFSSINYISAALALPNGDQPSLSNASSAIIDRVTLGPAGGNLIFSTFLGLIDNVTRQARRFTWSSTSQINAPEIDACELEVFIARQTTYNPGDCSNDLVRRQESPLWINYAAGARSDMTLPTLPNSWPRSGASGLLSEEDINADEELRTRVRCVRFSDNLPPRLSGFQWSTRVITHSTTNQVSY